MVKGGKYYKGDSVAVLVSEGHGAGWSSWAHTEEQQKLAMFDPEIVQWILDGKPNNHLALADPMHRRSYFTDKYGGEYFYDGGFDGLTVEWVKVGTKFRITEYDGCEDIQTMENVKWIEA
jgi:hypothetical protein